MKPQRQQEFVACYEAFYWLKSRAPYGAEELNREYKTDYTDEEFEKVLANESLAKYLDERAVPNKHKPQPKLTPKQLDFLRLVLDPNDNRLLSMKMKECRVSAAEHASWMRDATFSKLVREETTKQLENGRTAVLRALTREASSGNIRAIQFYMELTGEYVPRSQGPAVSVNVHSDVRNLTQGILEILQRHVPPATLMLVADEFEELLFPQAHSARISEPRTTVTVKSRINSTLPVGQSSAQKSDLIDLDDEISI